MAAGPAGGAYALPQTPCRNKGPTSKGERKGGVGKGTPPKKIKMSRINTVVAYHQRISTI